MLRRALVSFIFVLIASLNAIGDPLLPGTVVGGTITANSLLQQSIVGNLDTLDPNGNPFGVGFSSQGGSLDFRGLPGTLVVYQAGIAGSPDQGNTAIQVSFTGTGPVIPLNANTPTLDLIGQATITFTGTVFASHSDMFLGQNPLFTISGIFSGPVLLHFTLEPDGFYQLRSATANLADLTEVPEPLSMLLFGSGLPLAIAMRRRFKTRQR